MRNSEVFLETDALEFVFYKIKNEGNYRGYRTQLARAAGCQPAYLSQVLAKKVQLTVDQAAGLSDFWGLSEQEADYFITLVELSRAGTESLRVKLQKRMKALKKKASSRDNSEASGDDSVVSMSEKEALRYYANWLPSAVHMLLSLKDSFTLSEVTQFMKISRSEAESCLLDLCRSRLVEKDVDRYRLKSKFMHVPDENLFSGFHHSNWRERARAQIMQKDQANNFHYTAICSLNAKVFQEVRDILEQARKVSENSIMNASESTLACMTIDWFEIIDRQQK